MLIHRSMIKVLAQFVSDDPTREALSCVHVRSDGSLEATNTHVLVSTVPASTRGDEDFPIPPGTEAPNGADHYAWRRCPVQHPPCQACNGTGAFQPPANADDLALEAAAQECDASDVDPVLILQRRRML